MKSKGENHLNNEKLEEQFAKKLINTISTIDFIDAKDAFTFFKKEMKLLAGKFPEYFSIEEAETGLTIGFIAENKRIDPYTTRQLYVLFKNTAEGYG